MNNHKIILNRSLLKRIKIAQAEGKDWKKELRAYLIAYRSTPHATTGVSPAELLFGRKIRTKLPELKEVSPSNEVRDRDSEMKGKAKCYSDRRRHAVESTLHPGSKVLVKQRQTNKLSTPYAPEPYTVVRKDGNSVVIESPEGVQYMRNSSHVKEYKQPAENQQQAASAATSYTEQAQRDAELDVGETDRIVTDIPVRRSVRKKSVPKRFEDFCHDLV